MSEEASEIDNMRSVEESLRWALGAKSINSLEGSLISPRFGHAQ